MLYSINHDLKRTLFCGPGAIALVTGAPSSVIYAHAQDFYGGTVKGMGYGTLRETLRRLGYQLTLQWSASGGRRSHPTLAAWARENNHLFADRPLIVHVGNHYGVVIGRRYVDNQTGSPVWLKDSKFRRAKVHYAWSVERIGEAEPAPVRPAKPRDGSMAKARALAAKHGITIEAEHSGGGGWGRSWFVSHPQLLDTPDDPCEGDHYAYDGREVLQLVETYVEALTRPAPEPALEPCPAKPVDAVAFVLGAGGPATAMDIACSLSIEHGLAITERQVRGAALQLVRSGRARWLRKRLTLQPTP